MTVTTTAIVATNCVILLDNAANVPVDISGSTNSATIGLEHGVAEWRTFSTQWKSRKVVGKDAPVSLRLVYSTAAAEGAMLLKNWFTGGVDAARSLYIDIPDDQPGAFRMYGEYVLENLNINLDAEADDVVRVEADLKPTGEVQFATVST